MTGENALFVDLTAVTLQDTDVAYGAIPDAAIAVRGGVVDWVGPASDMPAS